MRFPFLDWWPLNSLIRWLAGSEADATWGYITTVINVEYVPFKNAETQKVYANSIMALCDSALKDGAGSPAYLAIRQQNAQDFAAHVRSLLVKAA